MTSWSRLVFEGHESLYRDAFLGVSVRASTQAYPVLTGIYALLGQATNDVRALVVFSALAGAAGVIGAAVWVGRTVSPKAGLWAGVLISVLPEHVAWSTSAYNVILPHALLMWAMVFRGRWAYLLCAMAVSMRAETILLVPLAGVGGFAGGLTGLGVLLFTGIQFTQVTPATLAFDINWPMVTYLGPVVLGLSVMGLRAAGGWKLMLIAAWVHAVGSGFDDYGARHALLGGVALCGLTAAARWVWVPSLALIGLSYATFERASQWNASDDGEIAVSARNLGPPPLKQCVEVTEEPHVPGQAMPSHARFFRGELDQDCVLWGEEFWHRSWSSRGLMDRAQRMRVLYTMEPVGALIPSNGGPVRLYHRLERRW
jgi:hypothetical protein